MIGVPAAIISHYCANIFRDSTQVADQSSTDFFSRSLCLDRVVDVGDVSLVMLGVMDLHRARVDVRSRAS